MPVDEAPSWPLLPVRPACAPFDLCTLARRRRDLLGRASDAYDLAWPLLGGFAAVLHSCRLIGLMRWLKTDDDECAEADPVG